MTNHRDWTRAGVFGTGVKVPLGGRDSNFNSDFGVRYHNGSEASYLREGSVRDNPDGSITITPLTNETDVLQLSKSGQRTLGRVDRAPSHAATTNSLLMN